MEQRYLIDTNVIIDEFGDKLPPKASSFLNDLNITISAVTQIELLGWHGASELQLKPLRAFMELALILPINEAVIHETIAIRQTKKIALGDAIIAATALVYGLVIVTRNISDFKQIPNLIVVDPWAM